MKLFILTLLVVQAYSQGQADEHYNNVMYIRDSFDKIKVVLLDQTVNNLRIFQTAFDELQEGKKAVVEKFDEAFISLEAIGGECKMKSETHLKQLKESFIMRLLNCKKLQDAINDFEGSVYAFKNYFQTVEYNFDQALDGLKKCFHTFLDVGCFNDEVHIMINMVKDDLLQGEKFIKELAAYSFNATSTVYHCIKDNDPTFEISAVLDDAKKCKQRTHVVNLATL